MVPYSPRRMGYTAKGTKDTKECGYSAFRSAFIYLVCVISVPIPSLLRFPIRVHQLDPRHQRSIPISVPY